MNLNEQMKELSDQIFEIAEYISECLVTGNKVDKNICHKLSVASGKLEAWSVVTKIRYENEGE